MTKKEIVKSIADATRYPYLQVRDTVQRTLDMITEALAKNGRIELRNFGVFDVKERAPRKGRNPRTGEEVQVPARKVVVFKAGKEMEDRIKEAPVSGRKPKPEAAPEAPPAGPAPAPESPAGPPPSY